MTSNAGTDSIIAACADPETIPDPDGLAEAVRPELLQSFKPAFLGRVTVVPYFPLGDEVMKKIVRLQLGRVARRIRDHYGASFEYDPQVVDSIASRCTEVHTGARNVDNILTRTLLPELSAECLSRMAEGASVESINISTHEDGSFKYTVA
jgi:type VI secretion system protein VasG